MESVVNSYKINEISSSIEKYFTEDTLFFDIECTGLSPRKSFIYLIGFASRVGNKIEITQLLAENEADEINLLIEFNNILTQYNRLIGYNSTRFDENFILERCKKYGCDTPIKSKKHIDMYLCATKAKVLLTLPNFKQKTIENFLGLDREDIYDGGQLIPVYKKYSSEGHAKSKELVLLHNYEDVKGMIYICDIFAYIDLLDSRILNINTEINDDSFSIDGDFDVSIKNSINKMRDYGLYIIKGNHIHLSLNTFKGILYTWLEGHTSYYYIIKEDMIVPKSIGVSIDPSNRRNATKADCKVKKEDVFVRLPDRFVAPAGMRVFKADYKSKELYVAASDFTEGLSEKIINFMLKH